MTDINLIIDEITELPTLPDVVVEVNRMIADPKTSAADINAVISRDMSLSAKILKLVNSPYYGFPRRITTITYAVIILGYNTVRNLALSAFIFDSFKGKGARQFQLKPFWQHSACTAFTASALAKQKKNKMEEDAFMCGLLHDIGKAVLNQFFVEEMEQVTEKIKADDCLFKEAEQATLSFNHSQLGARLLERWNLPENIVAAVEFHHTPSEADQTHLELTSIIHVADIITRSLLLGSGGDLRIPCLDPLAWQRLDLSWDDIDAVMAEVSAKTSGAADFLEIG